MALALLASRAGDDKKAWPEFAESDCFACHHHLQEPSWRQKRGYGKRLPGSLPWSSWYYALLPQVPGVEGAGSLEDLRKLMERPFPNREETTRQAKAASDRLRPLVAKVNATKYDRATVQKLFAHFAAEGQKATPPDWDVAEQLCLALTALNQALRDDLTAAKEKPTSRDMELEKVILELNQKLAFTRYNGRYYDSPREFRQGDKFDAELGDLFKRLK